MRPFVDTNVLVYAHDRDEQIKRDIALSILEEYGGELVCSTQVLAEFYVATTRRLARPLDTTTASTQVDSLAHGTVVPVDADLVREATRLSQHHQLSLWDAMIVRAAGRAGCDIVLTEDLQDGMRIDGVEIRNPFRECS